MTSLGDRSKCLHLVAELHIWVHKQAHSSIGQTQLVQMWNVQLENTWTGCMELGRIH